MLMKGDVYSGIWCGKEQVAEKALNCGAAKQYQST